MLTKDLYQYNDICQGFQNWNLELSCSNAACYFSRFMSALNTTFIPQIAEYYDNALGTCICSQDKMIKPLLVLFYDLKYFIIIIFFYQIKHKPHEKKKAQNSLYILHCTREKRLEWSKDDELSFDQFFLFIIRCLIILFSIACLTTQDPSNYRWWCYWMLSATICPADPKLERKKRGSLFVRKNISKLLSKLKRVGT